MRRTSISSEQATNLILNFIMFIIPNFIKDSPNRKLNK